MFTSLPQQTVFEARAKAKRDTFLLVLVLFLVYAVCFAVMGLAFFGALGGVYILSGSFGKVAAFGVVVGILFAITHYLMASQRTLEDLLAAFSTRPADPSDEYHAVFLRLVREVEAATGLRGIRAVVISTPALNAFSLADGKGNMAIGATEGILGRLDRAELGAVTAHEAAHLVQGDSRLLTVTGSLCSAFETITDVLAPSSDSGSRGGWGRTTYGRNRGGAGAVLVIFLVAMAGRLLTWMLSMALSRSREYMADAQAVRMTKNPLALAEALRKIAGKFRGGGDPPAGFQGVFILNPRASGLDEEENALADLFSTHPPVGRRIQKLLEWAQADLSSLKKPPVEETKRAPAKASGVPRYNAFLQGAWMGPYTFPQLLASGGLRPDTWVCAEGTQAVAKAGESSDLSPIFTKKMKGTLAAEKCPQCHVPLARRTYEGASILSCAFCKGTLLKPGLMERVVARREEVFDEGRVKEALDWRKAQMERSLGETPGGLVIACPSCGKAMSKAFHLMLTRVVIDRCPYDGMVWLDGGELETIQILVEQSAKLK